MLFPGRIRGAQAAACESFSAAPSLRFFYRLLLLLGAAFVAFWLATGAANADAGSAPPAEGSASIGTESPPVAEPATDTVTEPVSEPVSQQATEQATDPTATDPTATDPTVTDPPATDPVTPPATDPPATDPTVTDPPATDSVTPPATDPIIEPVLPPVTEPVTDVVEPVVVPAPVPGSLIADASFAVRLASATVCGGVAGAESVTGWSATAVDTGAVRGDMIESPRSAPKVPAQAPTAPSIPSIPPSAPCPPSAPGHGPASVSGWGGVAHSLGVLDNPDVGATLSAERFAAGDDAVPHSRAALLRTWPG